MAMMCPVCSQHFEQRLQCPRCQVNLVLPTSRQTDSSEISLPPHWSRNLWGRALLGVLVAQGLYYVLRSLLLAGVLVVSDETEPVPFSLYGVLWMQALQLVALFIGSFLAGAGQRYGGLAGSMVGVWNGILCTMLQGLHGESITAVNLYGQPILHTAFGALGGLLGSWIWRPFPTTAAPSVKPLPRATGKGATPFRLNHVNIQWGRVFVGLAIAAGGYLWADTILQIVLKTSEGRMTVRTSMQQMVMTLEISALAVFLGGAFSGATTWHGAAQGAWTGILCAALFLGYQLGYRHSRDITSLGPLTGGILALSLLGGSFGSHLLPPIIQVKRKQGIAPA